MRNIPSIFLVRLFYLVCTCRINELYGLITTFLVCKKKKNLKYLIDVTKFIFLIMYVFLYYKVLTLHTQLVFTAS